jgi:pimeloyl-ACP methyl ester carboxylesterase
MRDIIVFAHANGFPAGTYDALFKVWRGAGWRVRALPMFGHDPRYPVASGWSKLRDQLIDYIADTAPQGAFVVGHSLGGILGLMAASRRPELVKGLVMLDSPVVTGWRAHSVRVMKATGLFARLSPSRVSRTRRHEWASRQEALAHYAAKSKFARWAPGVLDDYVGAGTVRRGGKTVLAFDRAIESRIYDTMPLHLGSMLRRHPPRCPVGFVAGLRSNEVRQGGLAAIHALVGERLRWIDGTHLFPMEHPAQTAATVLELLQHMR